MRFLERKKILIIGMTNVMGGAETFIYNSTIHSDKDKYQYEFLIHGEEACVFQDEINKFYNGEAKFYFVSRYKSQPVKCLRELHQFFKENGSKYKYIHIHTGLTAEILYCFPFCWIYKNKIILHSHYSGDLNKKQNLLFRPLANLLAYKRLACSTAAADWLYGKKYAKTAIVINNGIDTERFRFDEKKRSEIRKKYNLEEMYIIGCVGRFSYEKNHEFLVRVFYELKKKKKEAKLMLVGTGELETDIRDLVKKLNLEDDVIFTGVQQEIDKYYSAFDCFVLPSKIEGLPIVGIEAQSSGLPCVFSTGIPEQVLITDKSMQKRLSDGKVRWAETINRLASANDSDRRRYADVVNEAGYGINNTVRELEKVYFSN